VPGPLRNATVPAVSSRYDLIVDRGETSLSDLVGDNISGEWIGKLMTRPDGVLGRVKRLPFKSLECLLGLQENLATEWAAERHPASGPMKASGAASAAR
jgi:hypothetical protein